MLVTASKVHLLKFVLKVAECQCAVIARDGGEKEYSHSSVTISHPDVRDSSILDFCFLRFRKQGQSRKRYLSCITSRGYFLMLQPRGRVVLSSPLSPTETSLTSAQLIPIQSPDGYTEHLFVTLDPGRIAMFSDDQLARLYSGMTIDSDYTIFTYDGFSDSLCWTQIDTVFDSREVLILAHNANFSLTQYALPREDDQPDVGLKDVLRASISSMTSRWFRRGGSAGTARSTPTIVPLKKISEISDPRRTFDKIIAIGDLTATLDKAGRVWVMDTNSFIIIRMLKGYRGGDIAWHQSASQLNLAVYLPSRRLLDVWRMRTGLRSTRLRLAEEGRLISYLGSAYFLTESGRVLQFAQSDATIRPSFFYDNSADPLTSATRFQRDRELVSAYTSNKNAQSLSAVSVENTGLLLPFLFGETNRTGDEYLDLLSIVIEKVEGLMSHPNKLVLFKTIKADCSNSGEMGSVDGLLQWLHGRKRVCEAYCEIVGRMKNQVDRAVEQAKTSQEVRQFLDLFHLSLSFDDEFVDAHGEGEFDKLTFEYSTYLTSWRQFYKIAVNPVSAEDHINLCLIVSQLLVCDEQAFEKVLAKIGKRKGASIEMVLQWVTHCDAKQLALLLASPNPVVHWLQSLVGEYQQQITEFIGTCDRLCAVFVLLKVCEEADSEGNWGQAMKELMEVVTLQGIFEECGTSPLFTLSGISSTLSLSRAIADWELVEREAMRILSLPKSHEVHIDTRIREVVPQRLVGQLNVNYYAIHRAEVVLGKAEPLGGMAVQMALGEVNEVSDSLLCGAALYYLYLKHIAKPLHAALEDLPGVSDLPPSVGIWLEALESHAQSEGSFLKVDSDSLMSGVTSTWLDVNPKALEFNLQQMKRVMVLNKLTPEDVTSVSAMVQKVFNLSDSELEDLIYLTLPPQAITTDPEATTQLFTSLLSSHKDNARLLSSILSTDEESLKIMSIKRLLEEGNDAEADQLIEEVRDTLKLSETLYAVARKRVGFVVQTFQSDPKYGLLLSNFPRKLMKVMSEDTSALENTSLLSAKDLLSRAIKYMDAKYSVNYKQAVELEDAFQSLYKLASEGR